MGFLHKLKGAMHAVTGGAARVTIEFTPAVAFPGDVVSVRITTTSTGAAVDSKGVFVDLRGTESVQLRRADARGLSEDVHTARETLAQAFPIAPPFTLGPGETRTFEGHVHVPGNVQPSYDGPHCRHEWGIRARLEARGNDPDSGYQPLRIGLRA
jgi:sporulation-control protein spo0M